MSKGRRSYSMFVGLAIVAGLAGCGSGKGGGTTIIINNNTTATPAVPARIYRVPSGSMEPTYKIGTYVTVGPSLPRVGDVVILHVPQGAEQEECGPQPHVVVLGGAACSQPVPEEDKAIFFIKRIVAAPGDEIKIEQGHVYRKAAGESEFVRESDPYIRQCGTSQECNFPTPIKIPAGDWFMMGDNRGESDDSRFWGPVPTAWIVGTVTGTK